ncbi:protein COFACTOR ASSEMBLY OF COMPLEX C SUBUNIT B CCB3, chloroplastic [Argentina anserina]|uniref:protein COFACTOR ASSEMBLY OF COMPLEX C SUBUNIT B CCB3, chloroplastic n=1 Tax=Argentina anserina TaxID=57926 RepID=UPI002176204D|nr:protein COFACTOR ASSEMBLY OF COMPLEX C SUBUNIT B CCB3, chloroplastic [Potentilla anserina]
MATCSYLLIHAHVRGWPSRIRISKHGNPTITESFRCPSIRQRLVIAQCSISYLTEVGACPSISGKPFDPHSASEILRVMDMPEASHTAVSNFMHNLVVADLDPATAKLAIAFLGPFLALFSFLFIVRIVMSWYPKIPVGKFPYVLAYAPTEPILIPTRKVIPPLGGVDVTPVVWFGLISFLNEILIGPQGLLVLLSQQTN